VVCCELQIFIFLLPLLIGLGRIRRDRIRYLILSFLLLVGIVINFGVSWANNFAVGLFAPQNITIFKGFINKPYTKLHAVALGVGFGIMFLGIQKKKERGRVPIMLKKWWGILLCYVVGWTLVGYTVLRPWEANKDPFLWPKMQNYAFIALSRPAFLIGVILLIVPLFGGFGKPLASFLKNRAFKFLARLTYSAYLFFPIVSGFFVAGVKSSIYLTYDSMFNMVFCHVALSFLVALAGYLFIEGPSLHLKAWVIKTRYVI